MISLGRLSTRSIYQKSLNNSKRGYATEALAAKYIKHGNPAKVVKIEKISVPDVQNGQVLVKMIKAPINPSDFSVIEGTYPNLPENSFIGGEGVGEVIKVGSGVTEIKVGDYVIPSTLNLGTWRTHAVDDHSKFIPIREKNLPLEFLACLSVNPVTAYRLLEDFTKLNKGDVIIQNGANSTVGKFIIQLAKLKGVRTVNLIRRNENFDHNVSMIKSYGGDVIDTYDNLASHSFIKKLGDLPKPKLALNCIGGSSATDMARLLEEGGTCVTYGSMSKQPITIPTSLIMNKDVRLKGFSLEDWNRSTPISERLALYDKLLGMFKDKSLKFDIESFDFEKDLQKAILRTKDSYSVKCVLNLGK